MTSLSLRIRELERQVHDLKADREILRSRLAAESERAEYLHFIVKDVFKIIPLHTASFIPSRLLYRLRRIVAAKPARTPGSYPESPYYSQIRIRTSPSLLQSEHREGTQSALG